MARVMVPIPHAADDGDSVAGAAVGAPPVAVGLNRLKAEELKNEIRMQCQDMIQQQADGLEVEIRAFNCLVACMDG